MKGKSKMANNKLKVVDDKVVSLAYELRLGEASEISESAKDEPLEFIQGASQIIPGLERELYGMAVGEEKEVVIAPEDAYGERDEDEIVAVPRDTFPPSLDLVEGNPVALRDRQSGESFTAVVQEIGNDEVVLDFNHPLAGQTLYFHVKIVGVRDPTDEEVAHGHVHGSERGD
jgi:FKBP-type peptidyl-prolyl cis-trans isomerase SlyD